MHFAFNWLPLVLISVIWISQWLILNALLEDNDCWAIVLSCRGLPIRSAFGENTRKVFVRHFECLNIIAGLNQFTRMPNAEQWCTFAPCGPVFLHSHQSFIIFNRSRKLFNLFQITVWVNINIGKLENPLLPFSWAFWFIPKSTFRLFEIVSFVRLPFDFHSIKLSYW